MKISEEEEHLTIQDNPGLSWLLAALFMAIGGLAAAGPLGLFSNASELTMGSRALIFIFGMVGIAVGGFVLRGAPLSTSTVDRRTHQVTVARRNLFGGVSAQIDFSEIERVEIDQSQNEMGNPIFQVLLVLKNGKTVPVSVLWDEDRQGCERAAAELKSWIRA